MDAIYPKTVKRKIDRTAVDQARATEQTRRLREFARRWAPVLLVTMTLVALLFVLPSRLNDQRAQPVEQPPYAPGLPGEVGGY